MVESRIQFGGIFKAETAAKYSEFGFGESLSEAVSYLFFSGDIGWLGMTILDNLSLPVIAEMNVFTTIVETWVLCQSNSCLVIAVDN